MPDQRTIKDSADKLGWTLDIDSEVSLSVIKLRIRDSFEVMPYRERRIIQMYYGLYGEEPKSLRAIGVLFDRTPERIRQLRESGLKTMRNFKRGEQR